VIVIQISEEHGCQATATLDPADVEMLTTVKAMLQGGQTIMSAKAPPKPVKGHRPSWDYPNAD
jgi:hypothetical protein